MTSHQLFHQKREAIGDGGFVAYTIFLPGYFVGWYKGPFFSSIRKCACSTRDLTRTCTVSAHFERHEILRERVKQAWCAWAPSKPTVIEPVDLKNLCRGFLRPLTNPCSFHAPTQKFTVFKVSWNLQYSFSTHVLHLHYSHVTHTHLSSYLWAVLYM